MADTIQRAWASLTTIIRSSNAEMFGSKRRTSQRIASGDFMEFLHEYGRQLGKWRKQFERFQGSWPRLHWTRRPLTLSSNR